jgi:hypothetical protein
MPRLSGNDPFLADHERRLRDAVEAFAQRFFDLTPTERKATWSDLESQCRLFAPLRARLRGLQRGLEVEFPASCGLEGGDRLLEHIRQAFVARPATCAAMNEAFLRTVRADTAVRSRKSSATVDWRAAVRKVRRQCRDVARLVPGFLDAVDRATRKRRRWFRFKRAVRPKVVRPATIDNRRNGNWSTLSVIWIVIVLANAVRGCINSNPPHQSTPVPPPSYQDWSNYRPADTKLPEDTQKALESILRDYQRKALEENKTGPSSPQSPDEWPQRLPGLPEESKPETKTDMKPPVEAEPNPNP